jgi:tRNA splicing endonuclease
MPSIYISREAQQEYYENINKIEKYKKELKFFVSYHDLDYLIKITSDDHGLRSLIFDTLNVSNSLLRLLEKSTIRDFKLNDIKKLSDYAERIEKYVHDRLKEYESLKEIRDKISEIIRFLDNAPENRKISIGRYISTAAHEDAHAIFHHLLRKYGIGLEFYEVVDSIDEGFGEAFGLYFMLKQVESGYISSDILKYGCKFIKNTISEENKKDKKLVKYVVGGRIFSLNEIISKIESLDEEKLSQLELKEKIKDIRKELGSKMEYIIGIIANHSLTPEEKLKKLNDIVYNVRKQLHLSS